MNHDDILIQVRQAHRVCGAFYQRMIPLIQQIAEELELEFNVWAPRYFKRPPQRSTSPFNEWQWNFLPLINAGFVFSFQQEAEKINDDDYVMDIEVVVDSSLDRETYKTFYGQEQADACHLHEKVESAESYLKIYLFKAKQSMSGNVFDCLWDNYDGYPPLTGVIDKGTDDAKGIGFKVPLAQCMEDNAPEILVEKIRENLNKLN